MSVEPGRRSRIRAILAWVVFIVLVAALIYGYYTLHTLRGAREALQNELDLTKSSLSVKEFEASELTEKLAAVSQELALSKENGSELLKMLKQEKSRNDDFADQIEDITGTVNDLDKLSKIDPELLQKYSKVYFLNEHYAPDAVAEVPETFRLKDEPEYVEKRVEPFLVRMLEAAKADGVTILVSSGYRSFDEQKSIKQIYAVIYGSGANTFSADQGYSEHQLGTTVDLTTPGVGGELTGFENSAAYTWLLGNAYRYGFTLSYPKNNAYYIFEPWHWRFVGEDLARYLYKNDKFFYDVDQRTIDTHLISFYDD